MQVISGQCHCRNLVYRLDWPTSDGPLDARWRGFGRYFAKVFAFGNAVWAAPVLFFGPGMLGSPDYENGLAICVAAAVNIHHFILDGAIWKLRNPKIAGILIRSQPESPSTAEPIGEPSWGRRFAWVYAGLFAAAMVVPMIEISERLPRAFARGDHQTAERILDRAALYGRDSGYRRAELANELIKQRNPVAAARQFWRSLALAPQADGFVQLGVLYEIHDRDDMAIMTWKAGLEEFPENFELLRRVAEKLLATQAPHEALPYLKRAAALRPGDESIESALERALQGLPPDHAGDVAIPPNAS